jgi:hypothetical protein
MAATWGMGAEAMWSTYSISGLNPKPVIAIATMR